MHYRIRFEGIGQYTILWGSQNRSRVPKYGGRFPTRRNVLRPGGSFPALLADAPIFYRLRFGGNWHINNPMGAISARASHIGKSYPGQAKRPPVRRNASRSFMFYNFNAVPRHEPHLVTRRPILSRPPTTIPHAHSRDFAPNPLLGARGAFAGERDRL